MDSYEDILERMIKKYEELSGVTVSNESDIMLRLKVLSAEIYNNTLASDFIKRQMFVSSASGEYLDKHALQRGISRKEAVKAYGEVTFSLNQPSATDILIEKGTVVATAGPDSKSFVTDESVTLSAGKMSVSVSATATNGGADYNVRENTVTVMVTPPLGINSVKNEKAFKGGVDMESDEELRQRVIHSYQDISNSTNAIYYKRLAESIPGVYSASVVSCARGAGTVNVYVCGKGSATVSADQIQAVQLLLDENRELNVDVLVLRASPFKTLFTFVLEVLDGYDFDELSEILTVKLTDYIDSLGVGKPALLCDLGDIIYHTKGVKNYYFIDQYCSDAYPKENQYCVVDTISVKKVTW